MPMYHYVSPEKIMKRAHECNWIQKHVRSFVFDRSLPSVFRAIRPLTHSTMSNNSSNIEHLPVEIAYTIPSKVRFWLYLLVLVPSTLCSLLVLHHLLFNRAPRRALNNHVIIVLLLIGLVCQLTIYPWLLYYLSREGNWARTLLFCSIWSFIDWGLYVTQVMVFAWASVERHILIFHDRWIATRKKRLLVHYLPLILLLLYCLIFYGLVYFVPPCENILLTSGASCIDPCLLYSHAFSLWETLVNQILPNAMIVLFNVLLLVRILWQKYRLHQAMQWRKHRKMTIQLLSISLLYLIFACPNTLFLFMYLCGLPDTAGSDFKRWAEVFSYYLMLLFPFVCIFSQPKLVLQIKRIFRR